MEFQNQSVTTTSLGPVTYCYKAIITAPPCPPLPPLGFPPRESLPPALSIDTAHRASSRYHLLTWASPVSIPEYWSHVVSPQGPLLTILFLLYHLFLLKKPFKIIIFIVWIIIKRLHEQWVVSYFFSILLTQLLWCIHCHT